ncbi:hypothetical protein, partial [Bacillus altitudinis]|uniref:hypothetical protein n=1 Tax=Bacillus altitudinis TaxID=293387 RepID=UPI00227DFC46
ESEHQEKRRRRGDLISFYKKLSGSPAAFFISIHEWIGFELFTNGTQFVYGMIESRKMLFLRHYSKW